MTHNLIGTVAIESSYATNGIHSKPMMNHLSYNPSAPTPKPIYGHFHSFHQTTMPEKAKRNSGFSLIEVILAIAITLIGVLGTLGYQYQTVKHSQIAQAQITATYIGQLVLEDWKSTGGDDKYTPESIGMGFTTASDTYSGNTDDDDNNNGHGNDEDGYDESNPGHGHDNNDDGLNDGIITPASGSPKITFDNQTYNLKLLFNDIIRDEIAGVTLRQITVTVKYQLVSKSSPGVTLTTYVRRDEGT